MHLHMSRKRGPRKGVLPILRNDAHVPENLVDFAPQVAISYISQIYDHRALGRNSVHLADLAGRASPYDQKTLRLGGKRFPDFGRTPPPISETLGERATQSDIS